MSMGIQHAFVLLAVTGGLSAPAAGGGVLYVDDDASPGGDGLSWATACRFLQDGLAVAAASGGTVNEIRVAQGVYTPDRDEANPDGLTTSCCLSHGGLGCDDPACEILVCDTLPLCCSQEWDQVCVALAFELCDSMCIDSHSATFQLVNGIALRGGYAGMGAPDPDARDISSFETVLTGDLLGDDGPPGSFTNTEDNAYNVLTGSGTDDSAILDGFTVTGGSAAGPEGGELNWVLGAGMWNLSGSPTVTACTFAYNYAWLAGGGIYNRLNSSPTITDCAFVGNVADTGSGGGMWNFDGSSPTVTGCAFSGNSSGYLGGGMANALNSLPVVTNCTFENNTIDLTLVPSAGGAMLCGGGANANVTGCLFVGNSAREGGAVLCQEAAPIFTSCRFIDNSAAYGGAVENFSNGNPTLINCLIAGNWSTVGGDGIGGYGGGVYASQSQPMLINCTVIDNAAEITGDGLAAWGEQSVVTVRNSIVYGNDGLQIYDANGATTNVTFSDVQGGYAGTGNIDADPLFVDPGNGDYRLGAGSPAIDAASNPAVPMGIATDLDGNPRFLDDPCRGGVNDPPIVDMGAYEFQDRSCDLDGSGDVGVTDFLALLAAWGPCPEPCPPSCLADFDGDCQVGVTDFLILLANWG